MPDGPEIKASLREFIEKELGAGELEFVKDDDPLLELGVIDSLKIFRLIAFVRERFGVDLRDRELKADSFSSVEAIAALVLGNSA